LDFSGNVEKDSKLMEEAGINVVRTYEPITDTNVLDILYSHGIYVINSIYSWGGVNPNDESIKEELTDKINAVKNHPAILMWSIGNEWNYNGLYTGLDTETSKNYIEAVAKIIEANDANHPIATIYGEIPTVDTVESMSYIDVWGLNMYRGIDFGDAFSDWANVSNKAMFISEYGAYAWNANENKENVDSQAEVTKVLTNQILENSTLIDSSNPCSGGSIFEFADEWWKDSEGTLDVQDIGGIAPGGGPYPDAMKNGGEYVI
jgi:beta-galactosidase/beta-glucuronidase